MSQGDFLQTFEQITAKQQNIKLELAIAYPRSSGVARNFEKRGGHDFHIFFQRIFFGKNEFEAN